MCSIKNRGVKRGNDQCGAQLGKRLKIETLQTKSGMLACVILCSLRLRKLSHRNTCGELSSLPLFNSNQLCRLSDGAWMDLAARGGRQRGRSLMFRPLEYELDAWRQRRGGWFDGDTDVCSGRTVGVMCLKNLWLGVKKKKKKDGLKWIADRRDYFKFRLPAKWLQAWNYGLIFSLWNKKGAVFSILCLF